MCLDGLQCWSYVNPLYYVSLARMEKRGRNQFFLPRHTAKLSILPSLFGMPLQNFIWEHKIYYCTCKSICLISHQRTDPTVEYSLKNGATVKQLPLAIRTKIHSFNIRLWDSEKNSQKAKLFFKKAIYKQVCLQLRGQNKGRISPILETLQWLSNE